jgi:hypothetical protein
MVPNGGAVAEKSYLLTYNKILGYGRPKYEEDEMTLDDFKRLYAEMLAETVGDKPADWAKDSVEKAVSAGVFKGNGEGKFRWEHPVTEQELAVVLDRVGALD